MFSIFTELNDKLKFVELFGSEDTLGPLFEGAGKNP